MTPSIALCTLYEGDYHYGLGALTNSLVRSGFGGDLWVGTRGERPPWLPAGSGDFLRVGDQLTLRFIDIDTPYHFSHFKPWFMQHCLTALAPTAKALAYIDPDIVIKAPWSVFEDWLHWGVALVGDFFELIGDDHLFRHHWRHFAADQGLSMVRSVDRYYNGGFVGIRRLDASLLDCWARLIEALPTLGLPIDKLLPTDSLSPFRYTDQDLLNATLECGSWPLATLQPAAMDLQGHIGSVMCHMTPGPKPWRVGYFTGKHRWRERSHGCRMYWQHVHGPIQMYSQSELLKYKLDQKAAAMLGRIYSVPGWKP